MIAPLTPGLQSARRSAAASSKWSSSLCLSVNVCDCGRPWVLDEPSAGTWEIVENQTSLPIPDLKKMSGNIIFQIRASETSRRGIHFLQVPAASPAGPALNS